MRGASSSPKRSESSDAIGRAPMVKMSRRIPPTPVAAPWYGSMNDGWLCDSILNAATHPSPMSITPAFSPGPCTTRGPDGRELAQMHARRFVRAVLRPHHREDPELGVIRRAPEDLLDALVLVRGEAVGADDVRRDLRVLHAGAF